MRRIKPDFFMDMKRMVLNTSQGPRPALVFGPKILAAKLYDRSSGEVIARVHSFPSQNVNYDADSGFTYGMQDQTLATMLVRPGCQFLDDPTMKDEALLTDANYGSVKKVYVALKDDASTSEEMQRWMVDLSPGTEAEELAGADHMAMCSKPRELCDLLLRIANKYD